MFLYIENTYFYNICDIFSFKNCQYIFTNDSGKSALKSFFVQNVETEVFHHTKSTSLFFVTTLKLSYRLFIDMTLISLTIISHLSKFLLVVHLTRWSILDGIPLLKSIHCFALFFFLASYEKWHVFNVNVTIRRMKSTLNPKQKRQRNTNRKISFMHFHCYWWLFHRKASPNPTYVLQTLVQMEIGKDLATSIAQWMNWISM